MSLNTSFITLFIFVLVVIGAGTEACGQDSIKKEKIELYYYNKQAVPPGGVDSIKRIIKSNLNFPKMKEFIRGTVRVKFIIDSSGILKEPTIEKGLHPLCEKEALRLVSLFPKKWKPAMKDGKPIEMFYIVPILFRK